MTSAGITIHAAVVDTPLASSTVQPRIASMPTNNSGVSPTRKSHQNRPNARTSRPGCSRPARGTRPASAGAGTADPLPGAGPLPVEHPHHHEGGRPVDADQHRDGQVVAGPVHPDALAAPEAAEADQHEP